MLYVVKCDIKTYCKINIRKILMWERLLFVRNDGFQSINSYVILLNIINVLTYDNILWNHYLYACTICCCQNFN